jgi:acetyl esterase/lipase
MPSLKSRAIAFVLKHSRKKAFSSPQNLHRWIEWARRTQSYEPPANLRARLAIAERNVDGFPVYEVASKPGEKMRILYLHGGAYVFEITSYHWALIAELAERLGFDVTVPIYPIAPEHNFHAMFGMVDKVYRQMLAQTSPQDIAFVGDSAGGNMAVVLTMLAARHGLPGPAAHVLISPGLDVSLANPETVAAARHDPWLGIPGGKEAIRLYSAGIDASDWRISPIYGDLSVLPRTLLLTGSRDMLTPDNLIFARKAKAAGVKVEVMLGDGMFHVWPLVNMPEARRARDRIVGFLSELSRFPEDVEGRPDMIGSRFDGRTRVR